MPTGRAEMLAWIDRQHERLLEMVHAWAAISSWSLDPAGIAAMQDAAGRRLSASSARSTGFRPARARS